MMTPSEFLFQVLDPGLAWCAALPGWTIPPGDRARVMLLAIAGQESNWSERVQGGNGPAHGFNQMERNGGVRGVLTHASSYKLATAACAAAGIPSDATHAWGLMATAKGDNLGTAFGRLLLWTDSHPLPIVSDEDACYGYYIRNWRPGKPSRERWSVVFPRSVDSVMP